MNRETAKQFRTDFNQAVKTLEEKYNAKIAIGNISYGSSELSTKLTVKEKPSGGKSIEQAEFEKTSFMFGLKPEDYNKQFSTHSGKYKIVALKPQSPKYPVIGKCIITDKTYKFTRSVLSQITAK